MKTRILLFSCLLMSVGQFSLAAGDSGWSGLWTLIQQTENGPVTVHCLVKSEKDQPLLYSSEWVELALSQWKVDGKSFLVNWQAKGGNLVFRGVREAGRMVGDWEFLHPQYTLKGKFSATRTDVSSGWTPLGAIDELNPNESGFVDLNQLLIKAVADGDFATFWRTKFVPRYYALVSEAPSAAEVERIVASPAFQSRAKAFHESVLHHLELAKEKTSRVAFPLPIVALCFGQETRLSIVGERFFVLANSEKLAVGDTPEAKTRSAEILISAELETLLPRARGPHLDYFRSGVPLYLASKLAYSDKIEDLLQVSAERAEQLRGELPELKKKLLSRGVLKDDERRFLAYDFVKSLAAGHSAETLVRMKPVDIGKAFRNYVVGPEVKSDPPSHGGSA